MSENQNFEKPLNMYLLGEHMFHVININTPHLRGVIKQKPHRP